MPNPIETGIRSAAEASVAMMAAFSRRWLRKSDGSFLLGIHAPMRAELTLEDLPVARRHPTGPERPLPEDGGQPGRTRSPTNHHWFLGDGMVHGIAIEDGKALWYRNRWIASRSATARSGARPRQGRGTGATTR